MEWIVRGSTEASPPEGLASEPPEGLIRVQAIAREVAEAATFEARPGRTEIELRDWIEDRLRERGCEKVWTITNVGFNEGSRICFPTYPPTERRLGTSDIGHVDVHPVTADDWWADCTRPLVRGDDPAHARIMSEMRRIHEETLARCRPGMRAKDLFDPCLASIEAAGYQLMDLWNNIGHSIWQGSAYDEKFIDTTNEIRMWGAWAIEPFIGNDRFGCKLEDIVWFGPDGCIVLR
jgi:Xaa-Pro dipeptidase